jgi:hypothetical protein
MAWVTSKVFDTAGLHAHGLRIERHQLQNIVRYVGADPKAKFLGLRCRDRIVVRPRPFRHLLRDRLRLIGGKPTVQELSSCPFDLSDRLPPHVRQNKRYIVEFRWAHADLDEEDHTVGCDQLPGDERWIAGWHSILKLETFNLSSMRLLAAA